MSPTTSFSPRGLVTACVVGLAALLIAPNALADEDRFEGRRGVIGLAYVYAESDFDFEPGQGNHVDQANGGTVFLTYRFNQWIASQARGTYLRGFEIRFAGNDESTEIGQGTIGVRLFPLAPLTAAIDDRVEPFLDLTGGLSHVDRGLSGNSKRSAYSFLARFGGGADVWITDAVGIELSGFYNLGVGDIYDYRNYGGTAGILYRF
ncbi:MAG: outer membrane beta-barrel protein [Myxococcota bacterium]